MSEVLTIRLGNSLHDPIMWLVWSSPQQQVIASGEIADASQISELTQYSRQRQTHLLLPSSQVLISEVTIPPKAGRQLSTILPFLMEDEITQDIDSMHFSILKKQGAQVTVASLEKNYLHDWLTLFKEHDIDVKTVQPDALALPLQDGKISALHIGEQWLFRKDDVTAVSADDSWLDMFLQSGWLENDLSNVEQAQNEQDLKDSQDENNSSADDVHTTDTIKPTIYSYSEPPQSDSAERFIWQQAPSEMDMVILSQGIQSSKINLLTGDFQQSKPIFQYWRLWRKVAIALFIFILVLFANKWVEVSRLEAEEQAYRQQNEQIFYKIFPDKKRIPTVSYLRKTMEEEEMRLTGGSMIATNSLLDWLSLLPPIIENAQGVEIYGLNFDGDKQEAHLQVQSTTFSQFESFRQALEQVFNVEQGPANREGESISGRFILRNKS